MSKARKRRHEIDDLRQQDGRAGSHRAESTKLKPPATSKKANAALSPLGVGMRNRVLEGLEANSPSSLLPAQGGTFSPSGSLTAEDDQNAPDRPRPSTMIGYTFERPVHTIDPISQEAKQTVASKPPQPSEGVEMLAQEPEPTQHHPLGRCYMPDEKDSFPAGLRRKVQNSISVWSPRLRAVSDRVRNTSGRVKVWAQEKECEAYMSDNVRRAVNPVYILAAITLGIPALLLILVVGMNPGVLDGTLTAVATFLVIFAFITAAVFEIKRLADQPSDEKQH